MTHYIGIRIPGHAADLSIWATADDNATVTLTDTGLEYVSTNQLRLRIDLTDPTAAQMWVDAGAGVGWQALAPVDVSGWAGGTVSLQPMITFLKGATADTTTVQINYFDLKAYTS
jgi:hypothetical protein